MLASFADIFRVFVQYNTRKRKSSEKREHLPHEVTRGGHKWVVPCYKFVRKFLTGEAEYSHSHERLGSCLAMKCSMVKIITLFECGPQRPPHIHMMSSCDKYSGLPRSSAFLYCTECKPMNNKTGEAGEQGYQWYAKYGKQI